MKIPSTKEICDEAAATVKQYPQYAGHYDPALWRRCKMRRGLRTMMGVAFKAGDITIAKLNESTTHPLTGKLFITAWSRRNKIDTSVPANRVEWL